MLQNIMFIIIIQISIYFNYLKNKILILNVRIDMCT